MKKHYGLILILVFLVSIGWTVCTQAMELVPVTSFDSTWAIKPVIGTGTGTVTTDGAKVNLSFQGGATGNGEIDFYETTLTGLIGMWATLRVDQVTTGSNGDCSIGIYQNVGKIGNSIIQLAIFLEQWTNLNRVVFRVRASDLTTNVKTTLIQGFIGDWNGGWAIGDSRTVAFARVGSEFWFYVVGYPGLIKVPAFDEVTTYNSNSFPVIVAWAVAGSSISGSVSDIYLIKE